MKRRMKFMSIIAIIGFAVIALSMTGCGDGNGTETDPCADGHTFPNWTAPTCTVDGNSERTCTKCTQTEMRTEGFTKLGHDESGAMATCTTAKICARAGCTFELEAIDPDNHGNDCECFEVAEKYRVTDLLWRDIYNDNPWSNGYDGTLTLGVNTLTTSSAGISYSNVHTVEQGSTSHYAPGEYQDSWAYLYSGDQKIGVAIARIDEGFEHMRRVMLGASMVDSRNWLFSDIDISDMQDDHNGTTEHQHTIPEKFRVTNLNWRDIDNDDPWTNGYDGTLTLGANTLTTSSAGFSYSNLFFNEHGSTGHTTSGGYQDSWGYLYSGNQKIGVVIARTDEGFEHRRRVILGATMVSRIAATGNYPNADFDTSDMQDDHNGTTQDPLHGTGQ